MALLGLVATAFTQAAKPAGSRGVRERQAGVYLCLPGPELSVGSTVTAAM